MGAGGGGGKMKLEEKKDDIASKTMKRPNTLMCYIW
jgi:hypothetical protein